MRRMRSRPLSAKTRAKEVREFQLGAWVARWSDRENVRDSSSQTITRTRKVTTMMQTIRQFLREEDGVAAAEYAILLGMIAVALITAVTNFRTAIQNVF